MICPNCGYNQQEGNVCGECHTFLKSGGSQETHGIEPKWKKVKSVSEPKIKPSQTREKMREEKTSVFENFKPNIQVPSEARKGSPKKKELEIQEISDGDLEEQKTISMGAYEVSSGDAVEDVVEEIGLEEDEKIKPVESPPPKRPLRVKKTVGRGDSPISMTLKRLQGVSVTTTDSFKDKDILDYKGIIQSSALVKLETLEAYAGTVKEVGGLRNTPFQESLRKAMAIAMSDLKIEAVKLNANGIAGVKIQYDYGSPNLLIVHMTGTAVQLGGNGKIS